MRPARWRSLVLAVLAAAACATAAAQRVEVIVCAGCHGLAGEGRPDAGYPPIAGQPSLYLQRQLDAYADGRRASHIMGPVARWLTPQQRAQFAEHFARAAMPRAAAAGDGSPRGRLLAEVGDHGRRVQACGNCHGPGGRGQPPSGPYLAGLDAGYLRAELKAWKAGKRRTDPSGAMAVIARHLSDADIDALAAHYSGRGR